MYLDLYWTVKYDGFCSAQPDLFFYSSQNKYLLFIFNQSKMFYS